MTKLLNFVLNCNAAALQNHNLSGEILRLNESIRTVADSSSEEEEDDNMAPPDQPIPGGNAAGNANNAGDAGNVQGAGNVAPAARPEAKLNKKLPEFQAEESTLSASLWLVDYEHTKG